MTKVLEKNTQKMEDDDDNNNGKHNSTKTQTDGWTGERTRITKKKSGSVEVAYEEWLLLYMYNTLEVTGGR